MTSAAEGALLLAALSGQGAPLLPGAAAAAATAVPAPALLTVAPTTSPSPPADNAAPLLAPTATAHLHSGAAAQYQYTALVNSIKVLNGMAKGGVLCPSPRLQFALRAAFQGLPHPELSAAGMWRPLQEYAQGWYGQHARHTRACELAAGQGLDAITPTDEVYGLALETTAALIVAAQLRLGVARPEQCEERVRTLVSTQRMCALGPEEYAAAQGLSAAVASGLGSGVQCVAFASATHFGAARGRGPAYGHSGRGFGAPQQPHHHAGRGGGKFHRGGRRTSSGHGGKPNGSADASTRADAPQSK